VKFGPAIATTVLALGCTSILGIDEDYGYGRLTVDSGVSGGGGGSPSTTGGRGGAQASGGKGGSSGSDTGGADSGAPPVLATCAPGVYDGEFTGTHAPSTDIPVWNLPLGSVDVAGAVRLTLEGDEGGQLTVVSGELDGEFKTTPVAAFHATLDGVLDCATLTISGSVSNGSAGDPASFSFAGSYTATLALGEDAVLTGTWEEAEVPRVPNAEGSGPLTATRVGP
jgi:hypothetical protein